VCTSLPRIILDSYIGSHSAIAVKAEKKKFGIWSKLATFHFSSEDVEKLCSGAQKGKVPLSHLNGPSVLITVLL
jgi:hypothetical protein